MLKILQITKKVPYPLKDGESIAVNQLSKGLVKNSCQIDLLTFNTFKHHTDIEEVKTSLSQYDNIYDIYLDNRVNVYDAFINLFSSDSYNISRFNSKPFRLKLLSLLNKNNYNIILIESLYMCPYIDDVRNNSTAKIVMRSHNIEYLIWERLGVNESFFLKRIYFRLLASRLKRYEIACLAKYDLLLPISDIDRNIFLGFNNTVKTLTVPTAFDFSEFSYQYQPFRYPLRLFFLGSLDWKPNLEGLKWFLANVMPLLDDRFVFNIAGRNCPGWLKEIEIPNVKVYGEIDSAYEYMINNDIMIVPLFSGSGIRIKILEAMKYGKAVITTDVGMEGINAILNEEILMASSPQEYLVIVENILDLTLNLSDITANAFNFLRKDYNEELIIKNLYISFLNL